MRIRQIVPLFALVWLSCDAPEPAQPVATPSQTTAVAEETQPAAPAPAVPQKAVVEVSELPLVDLELNEQPRQWKTTTMKSPRKLEGETTTHHALADGRALRVGSERSLLLDQTGEVLKSIDGWVSVQHTRSHLERWGGMGDEKIVDLRSGEVHEIVISNREETKASRSRSELLIAGEAVWWVSTKWRSGPKDVWIARIDPGKPATATKVAFPASPSFNRVGYELEKDWLLLANQKYDHREDEPDCPMMVFDGTKARCLATRPTHDWVVHEGQFMGLGNHDDRVVDLLQTREVRFGTPDCSPYLFGYENGTGNIFLWCKDSRRFGLRTPKNELLLTELPEGRWSISTPSGLTPRFFQYGRRRISPDVKSMPETAIVDMQGTVIVLRERVFAVGDNFAISEFEGNHGLVDLVNHTIEPIELIECGDGQRLAVTHTSGDRFITSCLEFDRKSVEGKTFGCGSAALQARRHTVRGQEVLDVDRATRYVIRNAVVEETLPSALIARAGGDLYIEDGGPDTVVFKLD